MIQIDGSSSRSIYEQVYEEFVKLISSGVLRPDEQLPSVRDLAVMLRINPNTIQKAYKLLETRSYVYSVPGKGNFVAQSESIVSAELEKEMTLLESTIARLRMLGLGDEEIRRLVEAALKGAE